MEKTQSVDKIMPISEADIEIKKEMIALANEMLALFVEKMNDKKTVDVLNISVNGLAVLINSIAQSLSPDFNTQEKIIDAVHHFAHAYHLPGKKKSC